MNKKKLTAIITAIAVTILSCYYLYTVYAAYDGGVLPSLTGFVFTIPVIEAVSLWRILTDNLKPPVKQKGWQVALTILLLLGGVGITGYLLVSSNFYSLHAMILAIYLVMLFPWLWVEYRRGARPAKNPVFSWAGSVIGFYAVAVITTFAYVQVVQPVTVAQATALVEQAYGEENYEYSSHLGGHKSYNPLGVYWFAQRNSTMKGWVEVDLLTGAINLL